MLCQKVEFLRRTKSCLSLRSLTRLSGDLDEGLDATLAVVSLRGECGHVVPAHRGDDVQHGLSLVGVRGNHAGEEVVARVVAELWSRRGVADLRNLWRHGGGHLLVYVEMLKGHIKHGVWAEEPPKPGSSLWPRKQLEIR